MPYHPDRHRGISRGGEALRRAARRLCRVGTTSVVVVKRRAARKRVVGATGRSPLPQTRGLRLRYATDLTDGPVGGASGKWAAPPIVARFLRPRGRTPARSALNRRRGWNNISGAGRAGRGSARAARPGAPEYPGRRGSPPGAVGGEGWRVRVRTPCSRPPDSRSGRPFELWFGSWRRSVTCRGWRA